jgi:hypothetical protein
MSAKGARSLQLEARRSNRCVISATTSSMQAGTPAVHTFDDAGSVWGRMPSATASHRGDDQ